MEDMDSGHLDYWTTHEETILYVLSVTRILCRERELVERQDFKQEPKDEGKAKKGLFLEAI